MKIVSKKDLKNITIELNKTGFTIWIKYKVKFKGY